MKKVLKLIDQMEDELKGSEEYVECAISVKDEDRILSDQYYNMSLQKMKHFEELHNQAVRMIGDYRAKYGEMPTDLQSIYDWIMGKYMNWAKNIKMEQSMYK